MATVVQLRTFFGPANAVTLRFRDSATGDADVCAGEWFDEHLVEGIRAFRGQFGFFRFGALMKYAPALTSLAASGGPVRLVLGSNQTDPLTLEDVESVLSIIRVREADEESSLTVVAFRNALFHPKVAHIVRSDGSAVAMVGSANLTAAALGVNVEAWIEMDSSTSASQQALTRIETGTDWWRSATVPGVFQVRSLADARQLHADGLLIGRASRRRRAGADRASKEDRRGVRRPRWRSPDGVAMESPEHESEPFEPRPQRGPAGKVVLRWCKRLSASDALQTSSGTHPTGKLRLGRAGHDIDQNTWFRHVMFGSQTWISVTRGTRRYEAAHIQFNVKIGSARPSKKTLLVDHAPHRAAGQHNVVTVLSWGTEMAQWLREHSQTGNWVSIEQDDQGEYWLRLRAQAPAWAPSRLKSRQRG